MNDKKKPGPWSDEENTAGVALYFRMIDAVNAGIYYNKAAMVRAVQGANPNPLDNVAGAPLAARSRPSIEMKLMNCSAAHAKMRRLEDTMDSHGYRAMPNYQAALETAVVEALEARELGPIDRRELDDLIADDDPIADRFRG